MSPAGDVVAGAYLRSLGGLEGVEMNLAAIGVTIFVLKRDESV
jgi:hypothetical protein